MKGYYDEPALKPPDWGWSVIAYLWLGGAAAGAFVVGALASLRNKRGDDAIARCAFGASSAVVLLCPPLLISHLGRPDRFHHMLRVFKPSSPMNAGAWALTGLSALAVAGAATSASPKLRKLLPRKAVALAGLPLALFFGTYTGVLLGHSSVPLWAASPILPALFACSSLASGTALVSLAASLTRGIDARGRKRLHRAERAATAAEAVALAGWLNQIGPYGKPLKSDGVRDVFQIGAIACGIILPMIVRSPLPGLVGALALRYSVVAAGKLSSQDQSAYLEFTKER